MSQLNKDNVLSSIDDKLNPDKTNFIEYIYAPPPWKKRSFCGFTYDYYKNPYGHCLIRYTYKGEDIIMNVSGARGDPAINFFNAKEYLFTDRPSKGNEQGGILNRSFIGIRVHDVEEEMIEKLHEYYKHLENRNKENKMEFTLFAHLFTNPIRHWLGTPLRGNCSHWTSSGMVYAGLLEKTSSYPLYTWFMLLFTLMKKSMRYNVIVYKSINHDKVPNGGFMYPTYWIFNTYTHVWNLDRFADTIVTSRINRYTNDVEFNVDENGNIPYYDNRLNVFDDINNLFD